MALVDTHCHLNVAEFFPDPGPAIARAREAGVEALVVIGLDPESSRAALDLAERHECVYAAVGRHPNYAAAYQLGDLAAIGTMLAHEKVVALGEVGLDNHWNDATPDQQERCLRDQLDLAFESGKPIVLHCREAYPQLLDVLEPLRPHPCVFHCFSGDAAAAERAIALGAYLGIDGPVTYKKNGPFRELIATLPRDRLVLETDSPFLPPEPFRGKPNEPALLQWINRGVASAIGISEDASALLTTANAGRLFRLM